MTFTLSDDEQNGVSIAVNTILKTALGVGDTDDWSATATEWWNKPRDEHDGQTALELLGDNPDAVVRLALDTFAAERSRPQVGIYVLPTEDDLPPRAAFLVEVAPGVQAAIGGAQYTASAWRFPDGTEVDEDLGRAITAHAEELGVEWDH